MATTIKVDGTSITINDKNTNRSNESILNAIDPNDLCIQAVEAYIRSDYMCKAYESMIVSKSTEAAGGENKFAETAKKVIKAIVDFFKKIAAYVTSFITGNNIMLTAKVISKKANELKSKGVPFPSDAYVKTKYQSYTLASEIIDVATTLTKNVNENKGFDPAKLAKIEETIAKVSVDVRLSNWFKSWDDIINACQNNQKGVVKAMVAMKTVNIAEICKKEAQKADALLYHVSEPPKKELIDSMNAKRKQINLAVKGYTTAIQAMLQVARAAINYKKPPEKKEDDKDSQKNTGETKTDEKKV